MDSRVPPIDILLAFIATTAAFAFIPGPAMFYAAAQTLAGGRWSGMMAAFGIHIGGYLHVGAAAAGLSILFHAVPVLYTAVKLLGAAYLFWLGISLFRQGGTARMPALKHRSGRRAFLESVAVEVLNPKTAIFFLAFLPQFIDGATAVPVWIQFLVLGTIVNAMFTLADIVCVLLAGSLVSKLEQSPTAQAWMQRAGGVVLVGLGTHLALQKN